MTDAKESYRQILRSSSVMAVAQFVQYAVGLLRTKVVALLLGPAGVGVVGVYLAITSVASTAAGLGLSSSSVRALAEAKGADDDAAVSTTIGTTRRLMWLTGACGSVLLAACARPLSVSTFGHGGHTSAILGLSVVVLLTTLDSGEGALLQGLRRVDDLMWRTLGQAVLATLVTVTGYLWLGEQGIVPVLIAAALANYAVSFGLGRRLPSPPPHQTFRATAAQSVPLVRLGLAFMWTSLIATGASLAIRAIIVRSYDAAGAGVYQAAWSLSGMFGSLVLSAMGSDFYPRLAAAARDPAEVNALVNQQTEIGILLSLPGVVATMTLAPWIVALFYSPAFAPAIDLLPGFVMGVSGRIISWPMAYVLVARNDARAFAALETGAGAFYVGLSWLLLRTAGLPGAGWGFAGLYVVYTATVALLVRSATGFHWSRATTRLIGVSVGTTLSGVAIHYVLDEPYRSAVGVALTVGCSAFAARALAGRLGQDHRFVRAAARVPGGRWILPESRALRAPTEPPVETPP